MTEKQLQAAIIALAQRLGWRVAHFTAASVRAGRMVTPVQADGAGFPDLVLVRDRVLFVELKQDRRYPSPNQRDWIAALQDAGAAIMVWRPSDWRAGTVERVLSSWAAGPRAPVAA